MAGAEADVTVAVITHDSAQLLRDCLDALDDAFAGVSSWQLCVVDSGSQDDSLATARRLAPDAVTVDLGRNAGYAAGVNAAAAAAPPRLALLVLNPDVRMGRGSVRHLLRTLEHEDTGVAVPRLTAADGALCCSLRREPTFARALGEALLGGRAGRVPALGEYVLDHEAYRRETVADWATGAAMLISAECLRRTGPWDESYFLYGEETDFALRARTHGFRVRLSPRASAVHLGGDLLSSPPLWSLLTVNRVRLYRRRHGQVASAMFAGAVLLNELLRSARPRNRAAVRALTSSEARSMLPGSSPLIPALQVTG